MSSEKTVEEALWHLMGSNVDDLPDVLGIDPQMPVAELRARLVVAQVVIEDCNTFGNAWWRKDDVTGRPRRMNPGSVVVTEVAS